MAKRVTLNDVAVASGVSTATVSFVLNDSPGQTIPEATRTRVHQAAQRLGYVPHGIARALREGSSRVIVLTIESRLEGNYSRSFIRGLDAELQSHDHVLLVRHGRPTPESEKHLLDAIAPKAVLQFAANYAMHGHELEDAGAGWHDGLAAHAAAQIGYLADQGHEVIALAVPEESSPLIDARSAFSQEVASRRDLPALLSLPIAEIRERTTRALRAFLRKHPQMTAVAAFDDETAMRVLASMNDIGVNAPEQLAVIGFDATTAAALTTPALTTLLIDGEGHGRRTARRALGLSFDDLAVEPARVIARQSA